MDVFEQRYHAKRLVGLSPQRKDGSLCNPQTDLQAGHAELFAATELNGVANDEIYQTGDEGCDFKLLLCDLETNMTTEVGVEVIWNGFETRSQSKPRLSGNLIINPHEPYRYRSSDIFVLVGGTCETGFQFLGWAYKEDLYQRPQKSFGYGLRYWVPVNGLRHITTLQTLLKKKKTCMLTKVISGGQLGADLAGLLAASVCHIATGGHIPQGYKTEKGFLPALARFGLVETKSSGYEERTRLNVWDSDGTILLARNWDSPGTYKTQTLCEGIFKPFFRVMFPEQDDLVLTIPHDIVEWIQRENIHILNIAGNRESKAPGIQKWATQFLIDVFKEIVDEGK